MSIVKSSFSQSIELKGVGRVWVLGCSSDDHLNGCTQDQSLHKDRCVERRCQALYLPWPGHTYQAQS